MPSWEEFPQERPQGAAPNPDRARLDELCAVVFTGGNGAELLKLIRAQTIDQRSPPRAPEAHLREDEAVRRFVATLEQARDRGLKALADKAKPKT